MNAVIMTSDQGAACVPPVLPLAIAILETFVTRVQVAAAACGMLIPKRK